jgi:hypothetical protein
MADTSKPEDPLGALIGSQVDAVTRIRELNERLIASARAPGDSATTRRRWPTSSSSRTRPPQLSWNGWMPSPRRMPSSSAT